jgi:hypothetical protein
MSDGRRTKSAAELATMRAKAWETRRLRYGSAGHRGVGRAYGRRRGKGEDEIWNAAIDAALARIDELGADRPRVDVQRTGDRREREGATLSAMHTRARTIRRGVELLRRPR